MNPEAAASEDQNGQKESQLLPRHDSASGTTFSTNQSTETPIAATPIASPIASPTLAGVEVYSNGTSTSSTPPPQSPSLKNRLQNQASHQGDSPKGNYNIFIAI